MHDEAHQGQQVHVAEAVCAMGRRARPVISFMPCSAALLASLYLPTSYCETESACMILPWRTPRLSGSTPDAAQGGVRRAPFFAMPPRKSYSARIQQLQ